MTRRGDRPADEREELLAAHVTGGLGDGEAAEVEALLAESPDARAEADAIARLLAEVRAAEPRPADEPDWGSMARAIQRACAEEGGEAAAPTASPDRRPGWVERLRPARWLPALRPLRWPAGVVGAAAMAAAILFLSRPSPTATTSSATTPRAAADARTAAGRLGTDPATPAVEAATDEAEAIDDGDDLAEGLALDPLAATGDPGADPAEGAAMADLERALGGELAEASSFLADLLADPPEDAGATAATSDDGAHELALDDDPVDPFRPADPSALDRLADELDDQDLEALDRFLAEVHAG